MLVKLLQCLSPLLTELFHLQQAARVNQDSRDWLCHKAKSHPNFLHYWRSSHFRVCSMAPGHHPEKAQKYQDTGFGPFSILSPTGILPYLTFFCLCHKQLEWPIIQHNRASHGNEWSTRGGKYSTGLANRLCPPHGSTEQPPPSPRPAKCAPPSRL